MSEFSHLTITDTMLYAHLAPPETGVWSKSLVQLPFLLRASPADRQHYELLPDGRVRWPALGQELSSAQLL